MSKEEYEGTPVLKGRYEYIPNTSVVYFYNFSVPLSWIKLSNNVIKKDNYSYINQYSHTTLCTIVYGKVSWYAVSNSTNYGGPYIGVSYSANVNWFSVTPCPNYFLSKLYNPAIYTYYNATIAVVIYQLYEHEPSYARFYGKSYVPLNDFVTVFEILWASPKIGGAVESSNGITYVIYTNSSGEYTYPLEVGDGSVTLFYNYFSEFIGKQKSVPYGYVQWGNGKINYYTGKVATSGWHFYFYLDQYNLDQYVHRLADIAFDAVGLIISILKPELGIPNVIVDTAIDIGIENYFINTIVSVDLPINSTNQILGSDQVYISYLNYSTSSETLLFGFIMNYSSYYGG